jgi:hypothetical protein
LKTQSLKDEISLSRRRLEGWRWPVFVLGDVIILATGVFFATALPPLGRFLYAIDPLFVLRKPGSLVVIAVAFLWIAYCTLYSRRARKEPLRAILLGLLVTPFLMLAAMALTLRDKMNAIIRGVVKLTGYADPGVELPNNLNSISDWFRDTGLEQSPLIVGLRELGLSKIAQDLADDARRVFVFALIAFPALMLWRRFLWGNLGDRIFRVASGPEATDFSHDAHDHARAKYPPPVQRLRCAILAGLGQPLASSIWIDTFLSHSRATAKEFSARLAEVDEILGWIAALDASNLAGEDSGRVRRDYLQRLRRAVFDLCQSYRQSRRLRRRLWHEGECLETQIQANARAGKRVPLRGESGELLDDEVRELQLQVQAATESLGALRLRVEDAAKECDGVIQKGDSFVAHRSRNSRHFAQDLALAPWRLEGAFQNCIDAAAQMVLPTSGRWRQDLPGLCVVGAVVLLLFCAPLLMLGFKDLAEPFGQVAFLLILAAAVSRLWQGWRARIRK